MKINVDCMRDVLFYIEENLTVTLSDDEKAVECNSLNYMGKNQIYYFKDWFAHPNFC